MPDVCLNDDVGVEVQQTLRVQEMGRDDAQIRGACDAGVGRHAVDEILRHSQHGDGDPMAPAQAVQALELVVAEAVREDGDGKVSP
jgi:hypothetical protein